MIILDNVSKTYPKDKVPALDSVSLHIDPGEFTFLVGKSGAGKSTLIKMITREETKDSGKIYVGGIDLDYVRRRHIPHYRRRLGVVFQDFKLLPRRTIYENVAFALEIAGMSTRDIKKTVPKILDLVGLSGQEHKFPSQLSGGQKQRVSIARAIARQPKILIADEPTANLDVITTREILDLLKRINDFGTTVLVTTHNENIVNLLKKRVITMSDGRIISDQKTNGLYRLEVETPKADVNLKISRPIEINLPGHALKDKIKEKVSAEKSKNPQNPEKSTKSKTSIRNDLRVPKSGKSENPKTSIGNDLRAPKSEKSENPKTSIGNDLRTPIPEKPRKIDITAPKSNKKIAKKPRIKKII